MLLHAPEELSLAALLRKNTTLLRAKLSRADVETPTVETGEKRKPISPVGVPLVLVGDLERRLVPRLLRRLRWGRFLRYCPDKLDEYAPLNAFSARYFLERLRTGRIEAWGECVIATWALGRLTAESPHRAEAEKLLVEMVETRGGGLAWIDGQRVSERWRYVYLLLFLYMVFWEGFHPEILNIGHETHPLAAFLKLLCFPGITALPLSISATILTFVGGVPQDIKRMNRVRTMAILTLGRRREPGYLSLFLREYVGQKGRIQRAAEVALREVLPLLEVDADTVLSLDFVPNLCKALQRKERQILDYTPQEEALEIQFLEALGKVGDGRALTTVERIAQRGRTPALQAAAQNLLPLLQSRSRLATEPNQLLRGALQPDPAPNTLLRPTCATSTPPEQLLRPVRNNPESDSIRIDRNGS